MSRPPVDVVMTAIGGQELSEAIERSEALLGYEASNTEPPVGTVEFVDFPFTAQGTTEERVRMLEEAVDRHEPRIAVAPDVEGEITVGDAAEVGDRLLMLGADHVVIVPKDVPPSEVPPRFRVGFPAADFGSDAGHFITEYAAFEGDGIHILGGSPTVQLELAGYGLDVESVDGSAVRIGAEQHDIWTPEPPHWDSVEGATDLYDRIRASLNNVVAAWKAREGQDSDATTAEQLLSRAQEVRERQRERADRERRRRAAGRGPNLADPDTGELLDNDGEPIQPGADRPEAVDESALNDRDREMIEAIRRAAPDVSGEERDGDSSDSSDSSDSTDDQQMTLST